MFALAEQEASGTLICICELTFFNIFDKFKNHVNTYIYQTFSNFDCISQDNNFGNFLLECEFDIFNTLYKREFSKCDGKFNNYD